MKKHWKAWLSKPKPSSDPSTRTMVNPVASTTEETLCTAPTGNTDEGSLSELENNITASNKDVSSLIANRKCIKAKLINTSKKDFTGNARFENLDFANEGDAVTLGYMDETEMYLVLDAMSNELGEISSPISSTILECNESNIIAIIDKITEDGQGIRSVSINVYA